MTTALITAIGWLLCAVVVVFLARRAPKIAYEDPDEIERIERIVNSARHHREQLEARADELVRSHGYQWGTCDADDLASVIFDGADYGEMLERIVRRKLQRASR